MNINANFEDRASSSRGKHEGESSFALCDRLGRTRDNSQRQLPTDHDYAVPTREYQTDQSSLKLLRLLLALSSGKENANYQNNPTDLAQLNTVTPYQGDSLIEHVGLYRKRIGTIPTKLQADCSSPKCMRHSPAFDIVAKVARIDFLEWTGADHLRHTKFVAMRDDKDPKKSSARPDPNKLTLPQNIRLLFSIQ
jgi:hypothetical protein